MSKAIGASLALVWGVIIRYGVPALGRSTGLTWRGALGRTILGLVAVTAIVGWLVYRQSNNEPSRAEWLEMEERFGRIDGEIMAMWQIFVSDPDRVEWNVQPDFESRQSPKFRRGGDGARRVERFRAEAHLAGQMIQRVRLLDPHYKVSKGAPPEDHWLSALGATIHLASDMHGSGRGEEGEYVSRVMERVVDASKTMCARLASRAGVP